MEVFRQTVAGNVLVGSYCALSNNGGLVSVGLSNSVFLFTVAVTLLNRKKNALYTLIFFCQFYVTRVSKEVSAYVEMIISWTRLLKIKCAIHPVKINILIFINVIIVCYRWKGI